MHGIHMCQLQRRVLSCGSGFSLIGCGRGSVLSVGLVGYNRAREGVRVSLLYRTSVGHWRLHVGVYKI